MSIFKKMKDHGFSEKHPIIGLLLFTFGSFVAAELFIGSICSVVLSLAGLDKESATGFGGSIGSLLVLIWWYRRYVPEYRFMPRKGDITGTLKLIAPILIYWVMVFGSFGVLTEGFPFRIVPLKNVALALMAGLVEEVCFREISLSFMAKKFMNRRSIPFIAVTSGLLFGITHIGNALGGASIGDALYQVLLCIFWGGFFSAVYLRKGNVWVLGIAHFLHDLLTYMAIEGILGNGKTELPDWTAVMVAVVEGALFIYGLFLLRNAKRPEILELWDYKWSRMKEDQEAGL